MKTPDGFINARDAAVYVGYKPGAERDADGHRNPNRADPQIRAFYEWARRHGVTKHRRGRCLLFRRVDLDRAIGQSTDDHDSRRSRLDRMADLGRRHARGEAPLHA